MLAQAREKHAAKGIEIVAIGIDSASKIAEFIKESPVDYPILVAGPTAIELMRDLGNSAGALPYTVVLDRAGTIGYRRLGAISRGELEGVLAGFLR